jgi:ribose-phosphate pyrophosphokinase
MERRIIFGPEMAEMGGAIARELGEQPSPATVERFPDGEMHVVLPDDVAGRDVVLVQSLMAPVGERLVELALLADACRRVGANKLTAVLPYFAYARQDHCTQVGEALGGEVMARLASTAGFSKVIAVDLHSEAPAGWFGAPLEHVTALTSLAEAMRPSLPPDSVVVSPDLGGAKRADRVARVLGLPLAIVHKSRLSAHEVAVHRVLGDVRGRAVVIVDDLISTGGTIEAAVKALRSEKCAPTINVLATHALLVGSAVERLRAAPIQRLIHSDSLPSTRALPFPHVVVPLAPLLAAAIRGRGPHT